MKKTIVTLASSIVYLTEYMKTMNNTITFRAQTVDINNTKLNELLEMIRGENLP